MWKPVGAEVGFLAWPERAKTNDRLYRAQLRRSRGRGVDWQHLQPLAAVEPPLHSQPRGEQIGL